MRVESSRLLKTALVNKTYAPKFKDFNVFYYYYYIKKNLVRWDVFHAGMRYLHEKYCPGYSGILPWTKKILPNRDGMINILASYKRNNNFLKTKQWFLISSIVPSCLLFRPGSHLNSPLDKGLDNWKKAL